MHKTLTKLVGTQALFVILFVVTVSLASAQSTDPVADLTQRINRERTSRGLAPLALNPQLMSAAQAHASDIARTTQYSHTGSDGSTTNDRVARAGYSAYSWGRRIGENWARYYDVATAMSQWMDSTPHRNNILHPVYREMGIGVAKTAPGGFVYVINFGAQPNVLPIFINAGAAETNSPNVVLTLTTEEAMTAGDGANVIGRVVDVQISNTADFANGKWQPYALHVNWTLTSESGTKTVYVKYRDARGRTTTARDAIVLSGGQAVEGARRMAATDGTPTVTPTRTATRTVTRTPSRPSATPTLGRLTTSVPKETPIVVSTLAIVEITATDVPTLPATETPVRQALALATATPDAIEPTATIVPAMTAETTATPDWGILGVAGIGVMLGVFAAVKLLAERSPFA